MMSVLRCGAANDDVADDSDSGVVDDVIRP
jgi:hypothetical protein